MTMDDGRETAVFTVVRRLWSIVTMTGFAGVIRSVAVVLPIERYESYQAYQRQRERDFAILDEVAQDLKDCDPELIETQTPTGH